MESSDTLLWAVIALLAAQAVALGVAVGLLSRFTKRTQESLARAEEETKATLQQARAMMKRMEDLSLHTEQVLRDRVSPAILEIGKTARGMSETVTRLQWIIGGVAATSGPGALALVAQRVLRTESRGRNGLLALGLGAGLRALLHTFRSRSNGAVQAPAPARRSP